MTYALIDNSTLTAVQRLAGQAETKTKDSVDTDIVALENMVQAILFYDRLIAIDDYKPQYREARAAAFPQIDFLDKDLYSLNSIEKTASDKANEIQPQIKGGEFANEDFKNLLELLQTHIVCTWEISSSVYHLTLKGLSGNDREFAKYGNVAAAIFSELSDVQASGGRASSEVELVDRFGQPIRSGYKVPGARWGDGTCNEEPTPAIKAFVAALVWLSNRSIFYSLAAKHLQADTFLYPIRQAYQQHYIGQTCNYGADYARQIVNHFSTSVSRDLIDIQNGGKTAVTSATLPFFSAWLAQSTGDPSHIIEAAYNIRDNQEFVDARESMREVRRLFDESGIAEANASTLRLINQIDKASTEIRRKYGVSTNQGIPVTKLVQVYNTYASFNGLPNVPDYGFKIPLPSFLHNLKEPRGFRAVYRNLTDDLSTVWSLGNGRDILGSRVLKSREDRAHNPKQEKPEYRNSHSRFKSPM